MTDIFQTGRNFLDDTLDAVAVQSGEYFRYGQGTGVTLNMTPLANVNRSEDGESHSMDYVVSDFGIRMATLVTPGDVSFETWLGGTPVQTGDKIHFNGQIFEVLPGDAGMPFGWTSIYRTGVRIHTIHQGAAP